MVREEPQAPGDVVKREEPESFPHFLDLHHSTMPITVCMDNSNDVHVGARLHYNAPVSLNQYVSVVKDKDESVSVTKMAPGAAGVALQEESVKQAMKQYNRHVRHLYWGGVVLLITTVVLLAVILPLTLGSENHSNLPPDDPDDPPDPNMTLRNGSYIYSRNFWAFYPPTFTRKLPHPTPYVIIGHTAEQLCGDPIKCRELLQNIYAYHVSEFEQPDVGYNFMIDFRGNVYEGRGWDATNFISGYPKRRNIMISFFGNYVVDTMTEKQIQSLKDLLALGVRLGKLAKDYKLLGHNQVFNGLSPGRNILKIIDTWPHRCLEECEMPFDTTPSPNSTTEAATMVPSTSLKTFQE